jgi:hypothetical protein
MERAKFRWLRFASILALGASTLSAAAAGDRHRVWVDPPSDLLAEAAPGDWSNPAASPAAAEAVSADPRVDATPGGSADRPAETGSITQRAAAVGPVAKAPDEGSDPAADEQAPVARDAPKEHSTRTASREDPPAADPVPVRRTSIDRERARPAPRHAGRRAHRAIRLSGRRSSFIERIFGPPRRGANVISTGSIR